jgi:hypothetical protein
MSPRHIGPRAQVRRPRRTLVWATFDQTVTIPQGGRNTVDLLADFELAGGSHVGCTVMRTHAHIGGIAADAATGGLAYGFMIVRLPDDIGPNVGPDPNAALEQDWMLVDRWFPVTEEGGAITASGELRIDLKAKRRCSELKQTYGLALHNTNTAVGNTLYRVFVRTLIALP